MNASYKHLSFIYPMLLEVWRISGEKTQLSACYEEERLPVRFNMLKFVLKFLEITDVILSCMEKKIFLDHTNLSLWLADFSLQCVEKQI